MVGLILAGLSFVSSLKAAKEQKKAGQIQQQAALFQNRMQRLQAMRQYRMARSQVLSGAIDTGASLLSSGYQGVRGSLESQIQANIDTQLTQQQYGISVADKMASAQRYQNIAGMLSMGAQIASGVAATLPQGSKAQTVLGYGWSK